MSRAVQLTERAQRQIEKIYEWYAIRASAGAERWYAALLDCLHSLLQQGENCPVAAESEQFPVELREAVFGVRKRVTHRVLFVLRPESIVIYAVRHLAQDDVHPGILE